MWSRGGDYGRTSEKFVSWLKGGDYLGMLDYQRVRSLLKGRLAEECRQLVEKGM